MKDMPAMFTPLGPFSWNNTYDIVQHISGIDEVTLIDDNFSANGNAMYETFSGQSLLGSVGAPAVPTLGVYGDFTPTPAGYNYTSEAGGFPYLSPEIIYGYGDGSVPTWSSGGTFQKWQDH